MTARGVVVLAVWVGSGAWLNVSAAKRFTVEEVQRQIVASSAELKVARGWADAEAARADGDALMARPELTLEIGQAESGGVSGLTQEWSVRQVLPFPTKIYARAQSVHARKHLLETEFENRRLELQHQAVLQAVRLGGLAEVSLHSAERQQRFRLIENYMRTHPQVSPSEQVDVALVENQIRILEKGILEQEQERSNLAQDLGQAMGLDGALELEMHWIESPIVPDRAQSVAHIVDRSRVIRTLEARVADLERRKELVSQDWIPDLVFSGLYRMERLAPSNQFIAGSLGISLPIWNRGQHAERAVESEADAQRALLARERFRLERQARKAVAAIELGAEIIRRFPLALVRASDRKFQTAEREFRRGRITGTAFLQTDAQIHETLDSIFESQWKYLRAWSELKLLLGERLQWPIVEGGV